MSRKNLARNGKRFVEKVLFAARKAAVDRCLDPERDSTLLSWATYSPWLLDAEFRACHDAVADHTLVDLYRCWELWHLLGQTAPLDGDILEVGTWRGGTGALLATRTRQLGFEARVHLCDTFAGVIKSGEHDKSYGDGEHADTSVPVVEDLLRTVGADNVDIHVGIFPEDTGAGLAERRFRFCHIDVDVYRSGRDILEWVWPRLAAGGIVVFDDFGFPSTAGIARLVHEWEPRDDLVAVQNLNGHAVFTKLR